MDARQSGIGTSRDHQNLQKMLLQGSGHGGGGKRGQKKQGADKLQERVGGGIEYPRGLS